ncbi:hypothetical protein DFS33DRAFT_1278035 [Desarmillaria ectypa]|nr:hypothetical protein DFS33DRAFT_1278035 [Desarmillaria ectypa]
MTAQTNIPPDVTDSLKAQVFQTLECSNAQLSVARCYSFNFCNSCRLYSHLALLDSQGSSMDDHSASHSSSYFCNRIILGYFDVLAGIARGIAPTLLVKRVAAGHARPDDSWQGSVISGSLRFGGHSGVRALGVRTLKPSGREAMNVAIAL